MPIATAEFRKYTKRLGLSELAIEYVTRARSSSPARRVESNGSHNTVWRYPSVKMGTTVALESSAEFTLATQLEFDTDVLEYWEQPPSVALVMRDKKGHRRRCSYVPDFLVVRRNAVQVVQVKPAEQCERLSREHPYRWTWSEGVANDTAAEERFSEIGLPHLVYSDGQAHKVRADNCRLILHVRQAHAEPEVARRLSKSLAALSASEVLSMGQLMLHAGIATATPIVRLIGQGDLFTDLDRWRLSVPDECFISRSKDAIEAHVAALSALAGSDEAVAQLSNVELQEAHHRLLVLRGELPASRSQRSIRRWRKKLQASSGNPLGLRPHHHRKGNRTPRISDVEEDLLLSSLREHYLSNLCVSRLAAYGHYLVDHQDAVERGALPRCSLAVSYVTYVARSRRIPPEELAAARSGGRAAAAAARPAAPASKHLSPVRAFERAHVDHYLCDIHVLVAEGKRKRYTQRPQLTAMRDEATGAVLAISLSFNAPSRRSCLAVIRDCVRRHERLPETIVVDNGAEFHSEYFEVVLARLGVAIQRRPPGRPRYGGTIEGWFHSLKAFLSAQRGNTNNDGRGRSAVATHKGKAHASWTLIEAYNAIDRFVFELFNSGAARSGVDSRSTKSTEALYLFPESGVLTAFNATFLALTAMPLRKPLKVDMARGIRHLGRWFTDPKLFDSNKPGMRLKVFEEPWDMNTVYALVDGVLVPCRHGSLATTDLRKDFTPALESIRHLECSDVRSALQKEAAMASVELSRRYAASLATNSAPTKQTTQSKARKEAQHRNVEVPALKTEYWP
ncbi:TnsA endonuclease N-terminal domain-containing protein [Pseudoxanthomonas winnipegensis]|uniref:TnsA endonuclease N-terminal domain-containing protein n=1 Tax=Pseudoxanthomonas winnipegensis TaxID=2480810 RepID=UPI0030F3DC91